MLAAVRARSDWPNRRFFATGQIRQACATRRGGASIDKIDCTTTRRNSPRLGSPRAAVDDQFPRTLTMNPQARSRSQATAALAAKTVAAVLVAGAAWLNM